MNNAEKAELLKDTITHLYSKEGRSKSYIQRLLNIDRHTLALKISEWGIPEANHKMRMTASCEKFLKSNRNLIKSRLDSDVSIEDICKELKITRKSLRSTYILRDAVLKKAYEDHLHRLAEKHDNWVQDKINSSSLTYAITDYSNEEWKQILGYDKYMVSNYGRIKGFSARYKMYYLMAMHPNKNTGRLYVTLVGNDDKTHNLLVARIVGHAFVDGYNKDNNTINHINGDYTDNRSCNLEWVSQSKNNLHAYRSLNRKKVNSRRYKFNRIVYKGKYEFKTVAAFARFIGKSETQTRRYLDFPEKHDIKLIS